MSDSNGARLPMVKIPSDAEMDALIKGFDEAAATRGDVIPMTINASLMREMIKSTVLADRLCKLVNGYFQIEYDNRQAIKRGDLKVVVENLQKQEPIYKALALLMCTVEGYGGDGSPCQCDQCKEKAQAEAKVAQEKGMVC